MTRRSFLKTLTAVATAAVVPLRTPRPQGFTQVTYKGIPVRVSPEAQRIYFINPQTLRLGRHDTIGFA